MMTRRHLTALLWVLFAGNGSVASTRWVAPDKDTLGLRLAILSPTLSADLKDTKPTGAGTPIKYQPNSGSRLALTLFYAQFAITGSAPNGMKEQEIQDKGRSQVEDYQFRFYYKYGTWDLFYQNYQGYYIENSSAIDSSYTSSSRIVKPDLKTSHVGIQYFYIQSPDNYSLGGTFDQNIRQTDSGGSFFVSGYLGRHLISADSPLVPTSLAGQYGSMSNFKDGYFENIRSGVGYGYTAVLHKFYFGFVFGLSYGLQHQKFDLVTERFDRWVPSNGTNVRVGFGYNGEKFFSGFQYIIDNTSIGFNEYTLGLNSAEYKIFFGTRFDGIKIPFITAFGEWLYGS